MAYAASSGLELLDITLIAPMTMHLRSFTRIAGNLAYIFRALKRCHILIAISTNYNTFVL
jgi:hypothetical protein